MASPPVEIPQRIGAVLGETADHLAGAGDWWTADQQIELAAVARAAFGERFSPPWMRTGLHAARTATRHIGDDSARVVATLAADARTIDRAWALGAIEQLGEEAYVEVVAIAATIAAIDAFAEAIGVDPVPLPNRISDAAPGRGRPDGMGDVGAYVAMAVPWSDANVARALTLSPAGNRLYRRVGMALYHDGQFLDLAWDRPITRPQTEVLATAVSAASECFY